MIFQLVRIYRRLQELLKNNSGSVAVGGDGDASENYLAPTILINVDGKDPVMKDEIFGPILPIVTVQNAYDAISFINNRFVRMRKFAHFFVCRFQLTQIFFPLRFRRISPTDQSR